MFTRIMLFLFILKGGEQTMVDAYVTLIIAGRRNIDQVYPRYREAVLADLNAIGLDGYGKPLNAA